jgi:glyoxylase-like metal-dependent hydrolase (beta-lactamase superfamily II)
VRPTKKKKDLQMALFAPLILSTGTISDRIGLSHWDHAGGNAKILAEHKGVPVIGGENCEAKTKTPAHGETFKIGEGITVKALHTPCHTQDSICYFMEDSDEKVVFTGDTLFIAGKYSPDRTLPTN